MNETENNPKGRKLKICWMATLGVAIALFLIVLFWGVSRPPRVSHSQVVSESKSFMAAIFTHIRAYAAEQGADGQLPEDNDFEVLGFAPGDLDGRYYKQSTHKWLSFTVVSLNPLKFTVTAVNENLKPNTVTLDQDGTWTEKEK